MLDRVIDIVKKASELMDASDFEIEEKGSIENIVTSSDLAVQHYLTEHLSELIPGCGFFCEEDDLQNTEQEFIWIIDPIDGTANYARHIEDCSISVALARKGELQLGVVYSPWRKELYCAELGKGATLNGKPIQVSKRNFEQGLFCTAMSTYCKEWAKACSDIIYDIYMQSNDTRRLGSAALELCMLASGRIELYFELRLQPWDYAAAMLILSEAGGVTLSHDGKAPSLSRQSLVIAANSQSSVSRLLEAVHRHLPQMPY